jgi:hypothetical protein
LVLFATFAGRKEEVKEKKTQHDFALLKHWLALYPMRVNMFTIFSTVFIPFKKIINFWLPDQLTPT